MGQTSDGVQVLRRGLQVLQVVNAQPGLSTAQIAVACGLARTTTQRILNTLHNDGFLRRDPATRTYVPSHRVLSLSGGFDRAALVTERAADALQQRAARIIWPMHFTTRDGCTMVVRASTDQFSPLAVHKMLPGLRIPLLQCSAGLAWLAAQPQSARAPVVEEALRDPGEVSWDRPRLEEALHYCEAHGHAIFRRPQRVSAMIGLAVPVSLGEFGIGALSVRFAEKAVSLKEAEERFVPELLACAAQLRETVNQAA
ncbi:MAG: helix-turn-helix domain-containing protein [Sinobacteraceae bacterium]|nr:helix-turn-helix domain-containing protein [Nevskiaceae bacterium]